MRRRRRDILCLSCLFLCLSAAGAAHGGEKTKQKKAQYLSITGTVTAVDLEGGIITLSQKLKTGDREISFAVTKKTKVYWSKTKMKVALSDLNPGVRVIVQFYDDGKRLVASRVVLPGGMKEAAEAILKGKVKAGDKK
jgi:Cu/Ag efflux protein CusF